MKRSNLDEMQEQELLKIEHNGCWLAFWGLLLAMMIQCVLGKPEAVLGEWVVFMVLAVYMAVGCVRAGIWDRRLQMNTKTNLAVSLIAGLAVGILLFLSFYLRYHALQASLMGAAFAFAISAGLCMIGLTLAARATKKRQEALNAEPEEEE